MMTGKEGKSTAAPATRDEVEGNFIRINVTETVQNM